jgi:predicted NAD-dependent protein-ADP-ribosyltransferase YbiA (DUF1768 family)
MYRKALFQGDKAAAKEIEETDDPKVAKRITSAFEHFDEDGWSKIKYKVGYILAKALYAFLSDHEKGLPG